MKIELKEITVAELTTGYKDSQENGVVAFGGLLDVRPPYQREFVYKNEQRKAVIETILHNYPLNNNRRESNQNITNINSYNAVTVYKELHTGRRFRCQRRRFQVYQRLSIPLFQGSIQRSHPKVSLVNSYSSQKA